MPRDFTYSVFEQLVHELLDAGYRFLTFREYLSAPQLPPSFVIMRHDVDRRPHNALTMAELETRANVKASYYFRTVPESFDEAVIKSIARLGHEIGYHYEDLTLAKGDEETAYQLYKQNLLRFKHLIPVKTICMHGSPMSKWDNRDLWKHYDYHVDGIIGEPYFDIDFGQVLYLTDTGRNWTNSKVSVRDRVTNRPYGYRSTFQLINHLSQGGLPNSLMINVHPERWNNKLVPWTNQLVGQNIKNVAKLLIYEFRQPEIQNENIK